MIVRESVRFYPQDFPTPKTGSASISIVNRVRRGTRAGQPEARVRVLTIVMQIGSSVSASRGRVQSRLLTLIGLCFYTLPFS